MNDSDIYRPWMKRYLDRAPKTLSGWRAAREASPVWKYLSKYGKLISFIFHHTPYLLPKETP